MIDDPFTDMVHKVLPQEQMNRISNRTGLQYTEHTENSRSRHADHVSCTAQTVALVADSFKKIKM